MSQNSMMPTWISTGILGAALIGFLAFVTITEPARAYKPKSHSKPIPGSVGKRYKNKIEEQGRGHRTISIAEARRRLTRVLRKDIINLAPRVYMGVKLIFSDEVEGSKRIRFNSRSAAKLKIEYVEISVAGHEWDTMQSDKKVRLLYKTFDMLQTQYPELSQYVRVTFDDGRQALDLKFDSFRQGFENP